MMKEFKDFSEVLDYWSKETPDKIFIKDVSAGKSFSYSSFNKLVNSVTWLLRNLFVKKGERVSVCLKNSTEFLALYFGCIRYGVVVNPIPSSLLSCEEELNKTLDFVNPKIVFIGKDVNCGVHESFIVNFSGENSFFNELSKFPNNSIGERFVDEKDVACLYYSSGTTATSKGILYSHKNMISLISSLCKCFGHKHDTIHLGVLPMGHTAITNYNFLPILYVGGTLIFSKNFISIINDFWKIIEENKINYVEVVPTILYFMLKTKYPSYSWRKVTCLPYVGCGSAPLPVSIQKKFQKRFNIPVANLYGLGETGPTHFDNPLEEGWIPSSIGFPLDVNECRILGVNSCELPVGMVGEIALKGDNVFVGYHNDEEAYKESFSDGFFLTGDLGYKDNEGRFFYVDRKKDLIIKAGVNIYPGEIDNVLFNHQKVSEVSTIGVKNDVLGEKIVCFVVRKKGKEVGGDDLIKYCSEHLQQIKVPDKIIFVDSIPKTPSGKFSKKVLRLLYEKKYKGA